MNQDLIDYTLYISKKIITDKKIDILRILNNNKKLTQKELLKVVDLKYNALFYHLHGKKVKGTYTTIGLLDTKLITKTTNKDNIRMPYYSITKLGKYILENID